MSDYYVIENSEDNLYVHYDPIQKVYFTNDQLRGAAVFHLDEGNNFIKMALDPSWKLRSIKANKIISSGRESECQYYKETHS